MLSISTACFNCTKFRLFEARLEALETVSATDSLFSVGLEARLIFSLLLTSFAKKESGTRINIGC